MIDAIVLVNAVNDRIPDVAEAIAAIDGVAEVYSVAGRVDIVAIVRVAEHDQLAEVIAGRIDKVDGVEDTETLIAFRAYDDEVLDAGFSVGAEDAD